jgi:hypothetical protein
VKNQVITWRKDGKANRRRAVITACGEKSCGQQPPGGQAAMVAGLNHCLPGADRRKCRQLRDDCHGLAFERRASVEVARER